MRNKWTVALLATMWVLVGGSSSQAQDLCQPGMFCDRDADGFVKDHKRCGECPGEIDCDDDDPTNDCSGGGGDDELFTFFAELVDNPSPFQIGSFKFDQPGPTAFTKTRGNRAVNDEPLSLSRDGAIGQAWDALFMTCDEVFLGVIPPSFTVAVGMAELAKSGADIRIIFADLHFVASDGRAVTAVVQLIGTTDQPAGELGLPYFYTFDEYALFASTDTGGPGGRRRCHVPPGPLFLTDEAYMQVFGE